MRIIPVAIVSAVMLLALSSGVVAAEAQAPGVIAQPFPSITLNMSGGVHYNLSYMGLLLENPNGTSVASFNHGKWNFTSESNGSYIYSSEVMFLPAGSHSQFNTSLYSQGIAYSQGNHSRGGSGHNSSGGGPPQNNTNGTHGNGQTNITSHAPLQAYVVINLNALNTSLSSMSVMNSSAAPHNYSFPQLSVLDITFSIAFQSPVNGPGNLQLIQLIKSSNTTNSANRYYFGNIAYGHSSMSQKNSQGVHILGGTNTSGNGTADAFYWWNNNFDLNNVSQNLTSTVAVADGGIYITFNFAFNNSTSMSTVYQDPYLGISGVPIFQNPIVKKAVGTVINFVIVNIKSLSAGLAFGMVLIGAASYSVYKKRRF